MESIKQDLAQNALSVPAISPGEALVPHEKTEASAPLGRPGRLKGDKARPESLAPDPRREMAQKAAKERWANWATKKAM